MIRSINDFYIDEFLQHYFKSLTGKNESFLDLGCGVQPYRKYYESKYTRIVTADVENRSGKTDVILTSDSLPFDNEEFDAIMFTEVLEHVRNPFFTISEISRILKHDGSLLLTCPFNYPMHEVPFDHFRFTEFQLQSLLAENKIEIVQLKRRGNSWSILHTLLIQLIHNTNEFISRIPIIGKILKPICFGIDKLLELTNGLHFSIVKNFRTLNPQKVGDGLKGISGSFAQWTLGYCILAKKQ